MNEEPPTNPEGGPALGESMFNRELLDALPGAFYMFDQEGRYVLWNAYMRDVVLGRPESEIASHRALGGIHPDDRERVAAKIRRVFEAGTEEMVEGRVLLRGGPEYLWMMMTGRRVILRGKPYLVGMGMDLTARRKAELALHDERQRLEAIIEGTHVGTWEWNMLTGVCVLGERWAEIIGYSLAELQPISIDTWRNHVHPDDLRRSDELALRHFRGETPYYECEARMRHKDGRWVWILDRGKVAERSGDGQPIRMMGTHADISERKRAEEALRLSEERLRLSLEATGQGLYDIDIPSGRVVVNDEHANLLPVSRETPVSTIDAWMSRIHPEDRSRTQATLDDHIQGRTGEFQAEFRMLSRLGELRWIRTVGRVMSRDPGGAPLRLLGNYLDVTAQREAAHRMEESLLLRREAEKIARMGAWKVSPETDYLYWTEGVYEILELPQDYRPGHKEGMKFYDAESVPKLGSAIERVLRDGTSFVMEVGLTTARGRHLWTEVRGLGRIEEGGKALVIGTLQDITARKESEQAVREGEQRLRLALQASRQGLYDLDVVTGQTVVNDEYALMLGYDPASFVETASSWSEHLHPDDQERAVTVYRDYLAGRIPEYRIEFRQRTASGDWKWILSNGQIVNRDARGRPLRMLGTHLDIDELKRAEERSRQLRDLGLQMVWVSDVPSALRIALHAALAIAGVDAGGIYLVDPVTGDLVLECHRGVSRTFQDALRRIPANSPNAEWARQRVSFHGSSTDMNRPGIDQVHREGLKAFSMVPIVEEGRLVGVLNVASRQIEELPMAARTALESVAGVVSSVLVRLRAQEALRRANAELEKRVIERTRELARSEAKFRTLFESTRDAIVISGPTGSALDCNPAAMQLFGYDVKREFLAQSLEDLSPEHQSDGRSSRVAFLENQELVLEQGSHFYEWDHRRCDGSIFPAEVSTGAATIDGQTVLLSMIRDISQRRAAENRLRSSEAQFRRLLELAPLPMGLANHDGGIVLLNRRFAQTFGYGKEEIPDLDSWWRLAYPDLAYRTQVLHRWNAAVSAASAEGVDIEPQEYRVTCRDGTLRDVIVSGIRLESQVLATFLDVTQLRAADADLRKLRSAVEQSPAVVVITDPNGTIEYVNPTFEAQTGYRAADAIGRNPRLLKSGAHSPAFYAELWGTLREKRIWRGELCNRRKDGSLFWESTAIAPVLGADGRVTHYVAIKEDITERRRAAEELHEAKEAAEAANKAKSRFLANMSHEIRTPMNVILGFAQLLQREGTLDTRQRQYVGTLNRSGEHLLRLINDILDMSRIEAGRLPLEPVDCDFDGLLDELSAAFRLRAEESGLELVISRSPTVPARLHTDSGRVRQILLNLLGNAFKFTSQGRIEVRVSCTPVVNEAAPANAVLLGIEVADTGPGILPAELERIFQPFEQSRTGENHGGTGLGLTISRQLARMLGGEISVTSRIGIGSTFRFAFQAVALPHLEKTPQSVPDSRQILKLAPGSAPPMILIVDDITANRDLLRLPLEEAGFATRQAVDGSEAVRLAGTLHPDLILMDLRMPVLDGLAATREIRKLPTGASPRILVVSAGVLEISESEWRSAGADGFLGTPVRHSELLSRVGSLLQVALIEDETRPGSGSGPGAETGIPASLFAAAGRLSEELREQIIAATEVGDVTSLRRMIHEQVCPIDAALGQALSQWVASFDYLALLGFLRKTHSSPP